MPSDILIIPNRNSTTAAPVMLFSGSQGNSIRLEVLTSGSIAFLGKSGSLFSISDNFSGSLMAVGDISGLPILEVFSDDRVVMGRFNSNALVVTGSNIGVGMASPAYSLDISGSANISKAGTVQFNINSTSNGSKEIIFRDGGSVVGYLWNVSGYMAIGGGSTTNSMFVTTSNGNVGIRKANPIVPLDVSGSVFISGSTSITGSLTVSVPSGTAATFSTPGGGFVSFTNGLIDSNSSQFGFKAGVGSAAYIGANNSQHLTVTTAGNVAIGKTTANAVLDVNGNAVITGSLSATGTTFSLGTTGGSGAFINLDGVAGQFKILTLKTAGVDRWYVGQDTAAESGGNAGSPFFIRALTDAGAVIDTPFTITRASGGSITIPRPLSLGGTIDFQSTVQRALKINNDNGFIDFYASDGTTNTGLVQSLTTQFRIASVGARPLVLQTNTTTALTLDTSQNATLSGSYFYIGGAGNFYVRSTGANNGLIRANIFSTDLDGDFRVRNAAGTQNYLTVDSQKALFSGSVGISKTITNAPLDVNGNTIISGSLTVTGSVVSVISNTGLRVIRASNTDQILTLTGGDGGGIASVSAGYQLNLNSADAAYPMTFQIGSSEKMRITSAGNVAIGKTTANAVLDVNGNTIITGSLTITGGITGSSGLGLFAGGSNTNVTLTPNGSGYVNVVQSTSTVETPNYALTVGIASTSNLVSLGNHTNYAWLQSWNSRPLAINPAGNNVGIGTTAPNYKLQVNGPIFASGSGFSSPSSENGYRLKFYDNGGIANDTGIGLEGSAGAEVMWFNALNGFYFNYGTGGQKVTFNPSGNVGIGNSNPRSLLHVTGSTPGDGGTFSGSGSLVQIKQNTAWSSNQPWALFVEGYSYLSGFRINGEGAQRALYKTAAGGELGFAVAGNDPITFTQNDTSERMRIAAGGNIGIGKTTPNARLDVNGNTIITGSLTVTDGVSAPADYKNNLHPFLFITFL